MNFDEVLKKRYSVRSFSEEEVSQADIDYILEAARVAPTAANRQPVRIKIITKAEDLEKVDGFTRCRFGASVVFLICFDKNSVWVRSFDNEESGWVDASIVTTYMMLAAVEKGLGTTWVMHFDPAGAKNAFDLPDNLIPVAVLPCGIPSEQASPSEKHSLRKPLAEILI